MHRLLVVTSKGGTGKTTTVVNTAVELARLGLRVLVADTDPQGHVAVNFGSYDSQLEDATPLEDLIRNPATTPVVAEIPLEPLPARGPLKRKPPKRSGGALAVLPCSEDLNDLTAAMASSSYSILGKVLDQFEGTYDICIIDRQGALSVPAHMAIRAADSYLFVGEPAFLGYVELVKARDELQRYPGRKHEPLVEVGYLPTRTAVRSKRLREYTEHFQSPEHFDPPMFVFPEPIRQSEGIFDDPRHGQPTAVVDPYSNGAEDYRRFAAALLARLAALGVSVSFGAETETGGRRR